MMLAFNYEFEYFTIFLKQPEKNNNEQKTVTDFKNESNGIIVSRVVNGSPAAKVGMKVKDLVVSVSFLQICYILKHYSIT